MVRTRYIRKHVVHVPMSTKCKNRSGSDMNIEQFFIITDKVVHSL